MNHSDHQIVLPFETSHAFIIGINDYEHVSSLSTAINDATALAERLAEDHGYTVHPPLLNASKEEMETLFAEEIPKLVGPEDRILFYFAGHGIALNSDDDPQGYFVPADATPGNTDSLVSMDLLHDSLSTLPCKHGMLIMDCCFAGSFKWSSSKWSSKTRDILFDLPSIIYEERLYQYARDAAWQVITSSASDQKAVDILTDRSLGMRNVEGERHSPFAQALLDGLDGEADTIPKDDGDGVITATELYTYLRDRVEDETMDQGMRQSPAFFDLNKHDKGQYIFLHPRHRLNLPPIPRRNPFMGLNSYNEDDCDLFFGRDRVVEKLEELTKENQLIVVSGASGTGKSSAIKAGLIPRMREAEWNILPVVRPGQEPMESLLSEIPYMGDFIQPGKPALLLIDQYEELITQCLDPKERVDFENLLSFWIQNHPELRIVISLRADFEPQFTEGALAKWWYTGHYAVPSFSQDELREVIIKPIIQEVLFFEPDSLVDRLMDAVNQAPGALPLLSFTLSELYHAYLNSGRTNRAFTEEDYEKLGGVIGALHTRANAVYDSLDDAHQDSMRKLMMRMVSLEGGELASRRVLDEDLAFRDPSETERIHYVAQLLVDARLVSTGRDREGHTFYEPAHDALVRAWGRLWEWIKTTGEETLNLMYKLSLAVSDYEENLDCPQKAKSYLWRNDPRLNLLRSDLESGIHSFNEREEAFLCESLRRKKRAKYIKRATIGAVMTILSLLSGLSFAFYQDINDTLKKNELITDQIVLDELKDAEKDMYKLRFEEAESKFKKAYKLKKQPQRAARGMMELAFLYHELGENEKAHSLAKKAAILLDKKLSDNKNLLNGLSQLNPSLYDSIYYRYYPKMVEVEGALVNSIDQVNPTVSHNFQLGQTEVTVWQYYLYAQANHLEVPEPGWGYHGSHPIVNISLEEAQNYTKWLSSRMYQNYRLPTDLEWEYAARGGKYSHDYLYSGNDTIDQVAWYAENSGDRTHKVAELAPNELNLFDMSGNAGEWCLDSDLSKARGFVLGGTWADEHVPDVCTKSQREATCHREVIKDYGFRVCMVEEKQTHLMNIQLANND